MKFSISLATVVECSKQLDLPRPDFKEIKDYANFSATVTDEGYTIEINDNLLIKYIGLVARLTKLLESAIALMQTDIMELATFITAKKEG